MAIHEYLARVYPGSAEDFAARAEQAMQDSRRLFVVTANPEIMMHAERNETVRTILLDPEVEVTPDGISVVKAMRSRGLPVTERITGVDLAEKLLAFAGKEKMRVFLLGAKEEVVSALAEKLRRDWPGMEVAFRNGYEGDKDEIFRQEILPFRPDLVLVAIGVPGQELLISRHVSAFEKGVLMGVGGSFDVLSGSKQRAPALFVRTNTEWLYRILREPSRLKRFWNNNVKFLREAKK